MSKPFLCLKVGLLSILLKKTQKYLDYSEGMFIFGFAEDTFARKNKSQNESFDYAAECGEQALIDTTPFKSHPRVTFIFRISYELTCGIVD